MDLMVVTGLMLIAGYVGYVSGQIRERGRLIPELVAIRDKVARQALLLRLQPDVAPQDDGNAPRLVTPPRFDCGNCHKCYKGKVWKEGWPPMLDRMLVCPICGNKRCPKASDHELDCTGSNEPGQPGSVY